MVVGMIGELLWTISKQQCTTLQVRLHNQCKLFVL